MVQCAFNDRTEINILVMDYWDFKSRDALVGTSFCIWRELSRCNAEMGAQRDFLSGKLFGLDIIGPVYSTQPRKVLK